MKRPGDGYDGSDATDSHWRLYAVVVVAGVAVLALALGLVLVPGPSTSDEVGDPWYHMASFDAGYDDETNQLRMEYRGGDAVARDQLSVAINGTETDDWTATSERVVPREDAVVVDDVRPPFVVELTWTDPETGEEHRLYRERLSGLEGR